MTGKVSSPGMRELLAVGDRARDLDPDALAGGERAHEVVARLGLDADHARVGRERLDRGRAAGEQAAAAEADEQDVERAARPRAARAPPCPGRPSRAASSYGWIGVSPRSATSAASSASRSPRVAVEEHDLGAVAARSRRACPPARRRASGSPRAPRAAARRARAPARGCPRRRSRRRARARPGASDATALYAPRNLNAPTRCRFSAFSSTRAAPVASSSERPVMTGVRCATPSSRRAAAWTSSSVITRARVV